MSQYQECSECRSCPASRQHRTRCADKMDAQFEKDMMDEMERRYLADLEFDKYVQSSSRTARREE